MLLHNAGDDVYDIYDTLNLKEDNGNFEETKIGLTTYFAKKTHTILNKYKLSIDQLKHDYVRKVRIMNFRTLTQKFKARLYSVLFHTKNKM
jgi:hypothetical protein